MKTKIILTMLVFSAYFGNAQTNKKGKIYTKEPNYILKETEAEGVDAKVGVFKINEAKHSGKYVLYYWANGIAYKNHVLADSTQFNLKAKAKINIKEGASAEEVRNEISKSILEEIGKQNVPEILKTRLTAFFGGAVNDKYKIAETTANHIFFPKWADNRINGIKLRKGDFEIKREK
jgi:hypothetical protein